MKSQKKNLVCLILGILVLGFCVWYITRHEVIDITAPEKVRVIMEDTSSVYGDKLVEPKWTVYGRIEQSDEIYVIPEVKVDTDMPDVGEYEINATVNIISNSGVEYEIEVENAAYTVEPRSIVLTIDDKESIYGNPEVPLSYSVKGKVDGHSAQVKLSADIGKGVGEYLITGIVQNPNYKAKVIGGTYTKLPRQIEIYIDDKEIFEGEPKPEMTSRIVGDVLAGDDLGLEYITTVTADANVWITARVKNPNYQAKVHGGKLTVKPDAETANKGGKGNVKTSTKAEMQAETKATQAETKVESTVAQETQTSGSNNGGSSSGSNSSSSDGGSSGGSSSGGTNTPAETKPAETKPSETKPAETKPAPPETKPAPPETKPAPPETKPAPPETKPAPPETKPAPPETQPETPAPPSTPGEGGDNVNGGGSTGGGDNGPAAPGTPGEGKDNVNGGGSTGGGNNQPETPAPPSIPGEGGDNVNGGGSTGGGNNQPETPAPPAVNVPSDGGDSVSGGGSTGSGNAQTATEAPAQQEAPAPPAVNLPSDGNDNVQGGISTSSFESINAENEA